MAEQTTTTKQVAIRNITSYVNNEHYQNLFKNALGKKAGQFATSIIELTTNDAMLQQCDQKLVIAEAAKAATLDLPLNKQIGFAYVVTFKNHGIPTPTLIISSRGFIQLALRTGQYKHLNAGEVYEGELQSKNKLTGEIDLNGERTSDKVIGFFAHFTTVQGFSKTLYMTVDEMCHYAKTYSPSLKFDKGTTERTLNDLMQKVAKTGPIAGVVGWKGDPISMAVKTVLKRLLYKYGYLSIELANAYNADEQAPNVDDKQAMPAEVIDVTDMSSSQVVDTETGEIQSSADALGASEVIDEDQCPV